MSASVTESVPNLCTAPSLCPLQSLSIENQHLKQRQAALNATLDMQQQLQAAAAAAGGGGPCGGSAGQPSASEAGESAELLSLGAAASSTGGPAELEGEEGSELDESAVDSLLAELAASAADEASPGLAGTAELLGGTPWQAAAGGAAAGSWFFSASLAQHVLWYRGQVCLACLCLPAGAPIVH